MKLTRADRDSIARLYYMHLGIRVPARLWELEKNDSYSSIMDSDRVNEILLMLKQLLSMKENR